MCIRDRSAGFRYFDCRGVHRVSIRVRGYCKGAFCVRTAWNGPALGMIPVDFSNVWKEYTAEIAIPDGVQSLYFTCLLYTSSTKRSPGSSQASPRCCPARA